MKGTLLFRFCNIPTLFFIEALRDSSQGISKIAKIVPIHNRIVTDDHRKPLWEDQFATPRLVKKIIDWCYSSEKEIIVVDWQGKAQ